MSVWCVVVCGRLRGEKGRDGEGLDSVSVCLSVCVLVLV
jgi:hypothetical protein